MSDHPCQVAESVRLSIGGWRGRPARIFLSWAVSLGLIAVFPLSLHAVSVGKKAADNSVEAQLEAFTVHEDFEVSLFADESLGIANPVAMHWDRSGRLWVLTTLTYAQLEPGENPNDTLVILEDTDGDGRADKSTVFADGLDMPMGFALTYEGNGGVYLGEGPDLLLLLDTDGDDRADTREVVLTGFGTGDTHQNISNFTWGPDGCLYFSQGLHCFSRVETPWGIVRGDTAGFWRFHPDTLKLEPFCFPSNCSQNPCGIVFDRTGALFIKSNNRELIYATPGLIPTTHQNNLVPVASIGSTPGKSMGGEYVESPHLPDWIQDSILIAGYYSHRVTAFPLVQEGAGYAPVRAPSEPIEILSSSHGSFRPVEIRIGPDGAIYVADWFNPIIGHYQASLRHPDRDEEHGRIWRLTAKGRKFQRPPRWPHGIPPGVSDVRDKWPPLVVDAVDEDPRNRLRIILAAANSGTAEGLPAALHALDQPMDRFLDYALEQTVHALAPAWVPAAEAGEIEFAKPEHLAYALETLGGDDALRIARKQLSDASISADAKTRLAVVLARTGGPDDLLALLRDHGANPVVLEAMAVASERRKVRPAAGFLPLLEELVAAENSLVRVGAMRLAGAWKVRPLAVAVRAEAENFQNDDSLRAAAARSVARIEAGDSVDFLLGLYPEASPTLRAAVREALVTYAPIRAARLVAPEVASAGSSEDAVALLGPFLNRQGASDLLAAELGKVEIPAEAAGHAAAAMSAMGRSDGALLALFQDAMGVAAGARAYSPDFVAKLAAEVAESGDAEAGKEIYGRAQLTCVACHQVGGAGGIIGPPLDTVGAGLSTDLLIESILWPQRQMKEGYFAIAVTTKGGDTYSGYREKEQGGVLHLRDTATGAVKELPRVEISKLENVGSLMPPGLTNALTREELRDLVAYLASLKG